MSTSAYRNLGNSPRTTVRLAPEDHRYYRKEAQLSGQSLSDYLRNLLHQGVSTASLEDAVGSVKAATARLEQISASLSLGALSPAKLDRATNTASLPPDVIRAIFHCQFLLDEIVTRNDMSATIRAKDAAERLAADLVRSVR
ncbi:hypothetical protein [Burkholderia stagnalis]|uniref:hypothetical protein n=1 Tax=Burkholderia stagnalis TaxID=1503054 RepID=UPI000F5F0A5C|nr:hypothetical protein [Burkholderia stagnalis]